MNRATRVERRKIADATLTLRLTQQDRELLHELVSMQATAMMDTGVEVTAASFVRGLIRQEARAKGLLEPLPAAQPGPP